MYAWIHFEREIVAEPPDLVLQRMPVQPRTRHRDHDRGEDASGYFSTSLVFKFIHQDAGQQELAPLLSDSRDFIVLA